MDHALKSMDNPTRMAVLGGALFTTGALLFHRAMAWDAPLTTRSEEKVFCIVLNPLECTLIRPTLNFFHAFVRAKLMSLSRAGAASLGNGPSIQN